MPNPKRARAFEDGPPDTGPALVSLYESDIHQSKRLAVQEKSSSSFRSNLIKTLHQRPLKTPNVSVNKIFAAKWLDNDTVLVGTKDNSFIEIKLSSESCKTISRPPAPPRTFDTFTPGWGKCGIHCLDINPCGDLIATGGEDPADCVVLRTSDYKPIHTCIGHRDWLFGVAWITDRHVVTCSRDKSVSMWTADPEGVELLGTPTVIEHDYHSSAMKRKFEGRVRELKYERQSGLAAALCTSGVVKLLDPVRDLRAVRSISIPPSQRELVSMVYRHDMIGVGSLSHITLLDPRKRDPGAFIRSLVSPDRGQGVRSICLQDNILSFGTGQGKIVFYDIRSEKYLSTTPGMNNKSALSVGNLSFSTQPVPGVPTNPFTSTNGTNGTGGGSLVPFNGTAPADTLDYSIAPATEYYELGEGWLTRDETYWNFFSHRVAMKHAVYAHAWDPSGTRIFAGGGPLAFGLSGGYMGIFD